MGCFKGQSSDWHALVQYPFVSIGFVQKTFPYDCALLKIHNYFYLCSLKMFFGNVGFSSRDLQPLHWMFSQLDQGVLSVNSWNPWPFFPLLHIPGKIIWPSQNQQESISYKNLPGPMDRLFHQNTWRDIPWQPDTPKRPKRKHEGTSWIMALYRQG